MGVVVRQTEPRALSEVLAERPAVREQIPRPVQPEAHRQPQHKVLLVVAEAVG